MRKPDHLPHDAQECSGPHFPLPGLRMSAPALGSRYYSASTARRIFNGAPAWSIAVLAGRGRARCSAPWCLCSKDRVDAEIPPCGRGLLPMCCRRRWPIPVSCSAASLCVTGTIGVGTAWLVTAHRFRAGMRLAWLLPLPLAVPTYITAYVYVEIFDAAGPVQMGSQRNGLDVAGRLLVSRGALPPGLRSGDVLRAVPVRVHRRAARCS